MPVEHQHERELPATLVSRLSEHLSSQRRHWEELALAMRGQRVPGSGEEPSARIADELMALSEESRRLTVELQSLQVDLRPYLPSGKSSWRSLPLSPTDRAEVEDQIRQLRSSGARTAGVLRGTLAAARVWNEVLQTAVAALSGVQATPERYSSRGGLVHARGTHILETRS